MKEKTINVKLIQHTYTIPEKKSVRKNKRGKNDLCKGTLKITKNISMDSDPLDDPLFLLALALYKRRKDKKRRLRRWYVRPVNLSRPMKNQFHDLFADLHSSDQEWLRGYFRISKVRFDTLLELVKKNLLHKKTHKTPVSAEERLAITLRLLATGDDRHSAALFFHRGYSTINTIFNETCRVIWEALNEKYVRPPQTVDDWYNVSEEFWRTWQFPLCLGAVDGKYVQIKDNYKGTSSVVFMGISDAQYKFIVVDIRGKGSQNDSSTFGHLLYQEKYKESVLPGAALLPGTDLFSPHVFIADDTFQLNQHVMKPFDGENLNDWQKIFNYRLSRVRHCIENAFGIFAARWRIFKAPLQAQLKNAELIIKTAVALHNFFIETDESEPQSCRYVSPHIVDYDQGGELLDSGDWRVITQNDTGLISKEQKFTSSVSRVGAEIRQNFADYFLSEEGAVPWQDKI